MTTTVSPVRTPDSIGATTVLRHLFPGLMAVHVHHATIALAFCGGVTLPLEPPDFCAETSRLAPYLRETQAAQSHGVVAAIDALSQLRVAGSACYVIRAPAAPETRYASNARTRGRSVAAAAQALSFALSPPPGAAPGFALPAQANLEHHAPDDVRWPCLSPVPRKFNTALGASMGMCVSHCVLPTLFPERMERVDLLCGTFCDVSLVSRLTVTEGVPGACVSALSISQHDDAGMALAFAQQWACDQFCDFAVHGFLTACDAARAIGFDDGKARVVDVCESLFGAANGLREVSVAYS